MIQIKKTSGLSEGGASRVSSAVVRDGDKILMIKDGEKEPVMIESDSSFYDFSSSRPSASAIPFPSVIAHVSNRCNLSCPLCYEGRPSTTAEPTSRELDSFFSKLPHRTAIVFGGLEPTCRDDLFHLIAICAKKHPTRLLTNGIKLADLGYARRLKESGLGGVVLAINGLSDEAHIALNGRPLLKEKLAAIENCERAGLTVILSMALARGINEDQMEALARFGMKNNNVVDSLFVRTVIPAGRSPDIKPFCLSEMVALLAQSFNEPIDSFLDEMRLMRSVFDSFGVQRCRPKTCSVELHLEQSPDGVKSAGRNIPNWARGKDLKSKLSVLAVVAATYGIRYPLGQLSLISAIPFKRALGRFFRISLRSWPYAENLDLEEIKYCTTGYYRDGKLESFCLTNAMKSETGD